MPTKRRSLAALLCLLAILMILPACQLKPARHITQGSGNIISDTAINAFMKDDEWTLRVDLAHVTPGIGKIIIDESLPYAGKLEKDSNMEEAGLKQSYDITKHEIVLRGKENQWYAPTELTFSLGVAVNKIILNGAMDIEYNCPSVKEFSIEINGAADGDFRFGALETLSVSCNGADNLNFSGSAQNVTITFNGAANIQAFDLKSQHVTVTMAGASNCNVFAEQTLSATINGVGSVTYDGSPKIEKNIHGLGEVKAKR